MANTVTGRVISISQVAYVTTRKGENLPKRTLVLDITRHDPFTGVRSAFENTPEFEFASDLCAELDMYQPNDIVTISFDIQGTKYTSKVDGTEKIFTRLRPYKIEMYQSSSQVQQAAPQAVPQPQQAIPTQPAPQQTSFAASSDDDFPF